MPSSTLVPARTSTGPDWLVLGAVSVTVVAWASAFVAIRWVGETFDPGPLAFGRLVVGSLALGGFLFVRREWARPSRREWVLLVVCGVAWFAVYNVALNAGEQYVDAGTTAMLVNVGPILIALLAGVVLKEGFPRWLLIGAAVAFSGALLIGAATAQAARASVLGVVLCLVAAATYAVGVLTQKLVLRRISGLQVTWLACTIGAAGCLPFLPGLVADGSEASLGAVAALLYLGLVPTALAFSTWAYALARMDAGRLGVTTYLAPPITIVIAWILLAEVPQPLAFAGGALCLVGVALSRRRSGRGRT